MFFVSSIKLYKLVLVMNDECVIGIFLEMASNYGLSKNWKIWTINGLTFS